jgi:hypothetical protein
MISRVIFVFVCSGAGAFLASGASAVANDFPGGKVPANAQCAAYGPGFAAAEGTDACVWTGGHVRVEIESHASNAPGGNGWIGGGAAPAAMRVNGAYERTEMIRVVPARGAISGSSEHLRSRGGDASGSINTYAR